MQGFMVMVMTLVMMETFQSKPVISVQDSARVHYAVQGNQGSSVHPLRRGSGFGFGTLEKLGSLPPMPRRSGCFTNKA
jgi:hypothetical protein